MTSVLVANTMRFGSVLFKGPHVHNFLQGMFTADVNNCTHDRFTSCFLCDFKGKVIANGYLFIHSTDFAEFICDLSLIGTVSECLYGKALLSKIQVSKQKTLAFCLLHARHACKPLHYIKHDAFVQADITEKICIIFGQSKAMQLWLSQQNYLQIATPTYWHTQLISQGVFFLTSAQSTLYTAHMLCDIPSASVSITKGCYIGQEIVARTYHLGQTKRKLATFKTKSFLQPIPPGAKLDVLDDSTSHTADVINASCDGDTLWIQVIMRPSDSSKAEFLLKPDSHSDKVISFHATRYLIS